MKNEIKLQSMSCNFIWCRDRSILNPGRRRVKGEVFSDKLVSRDTFKGSILVERGTHRREDVVWVTGSTSSCAVACIKHKR